MEVSTNKTYHISIGSVLNAKIQHDVHIWQEFNSSFKNRELTLAEIASTLNDGHAISVCYDPQIRKAENYKLGQHICLDFDDDGKLGTIDGLMEDTFIKKYAAIICTAESHATDRQKSRAIFLLDSPIYQIENYALSASSLLWLFSTADNQCKDPTRFFYTGNPRISEIKCLKNELPLILVKDLIQRYQSIKRSCR